MPRLVVTASQKPEGWDRAVGHEEAWQGGPGAHGHGGQAADQNRNLRQIFILDDFKSVQLSRFKSLKIGAALSGSSKSVVGLGIMSETGESEPDSEPVHAMDQGESSVVFGYTGLV